MINEDRLKEALILIFGYLKVQQETINAYGVEMTAIREAVANRDPEFFELLQKKRAALEDRVSAETRRLVQQIEEIIQKLGAGYLNDEEEDD